MKKQRETTQFLAPIRPERQGEGKYTIYPTFPMGLHQIKTGLRNLALDLLEAKRVVIDGYVGLFWEEIEHELVTLWSESGKRVCVYRTADYMKSESEIDTMISPFLNGDDPIFGHITDLTLSDWFNSVFFALPEPDSNTDIQLVIGCGASLVNGDAPLVYVDLPKNELQFRARAKAARNLGSSIDLNSKQTYKRFYFVDWVVLNNHKSEIINQIDYFVDGQHTENTPYTTGAALRSSLEQMSENFFRVRPWFEPGAWGGTWMRDRIEQLNKDVPNLAWSFELMVLENGLLFESDGIMLEVSFDTLMFAQYKKVLGKSAERFRYDFPIRFDFLDTFDGGNLSIQCHPRPEYIKEKFGMPFTQDETYYILDCKEDAQVYLGFQEGVNPHEFKKALMDSQRKSEAIDIERFVQKIPAKKHDLFLIPNGTVHGSGSNNMVLEISSAPYIFTFKMYDWMRLDLDGKPRPINIEHGMNNLYFERQGEKVAEELISKPVINSTSENCTIEVLPTHSTQFYEIFRYTIPANQCVKVDTQNHAQVWMIVEGTSVTIQTSKGMKQPFHYAETFVIPAASESYRLTNSSSADVILLMSQIKDNAIK
ncbi:MAG: class I mannose-6-phosphate isomerase [Phocaeicola sp.]